MKHLVKISAISALLLFVASNGWADENKSFNQNNFEDDWNRIGEIEGAFAWFNQAIQATNPSLADNRNKLKYNPSERIIIFLPDEDDLEVCNFKKAKEFDKKAYLKQKNNFLNKRYLNWVIPGDWKSGQKLYPAKTNEKYLQYWNQVSAQLGIPEFKEARKLFDKRKKRAKTFKDMLNKLRLGFASSENKYTINSVQIRVKVSLDSNPAILDFQGCVLVLEHQIDFNPKDFTADYLSEYDVVDSNFTVGTLEMPLTERGKNLYTSRIMTALSQQGNNNNLNLKQKLDDLGGLESLINNSATDFWSLPNFYGNNRRKTLEKDPFESQAEYEERLSRVKVEQNKYGIFKIDNPLNLVNKTDYTRESIYTTYDVENQEFVITIDDSDSSGVFALGYFLKDSDYSTYEAENAFGARVTVSKSTGTSGRFEIIGQDSSDDLIYRFPFPRDKARQLSKDMKIIILMSYQQSNDNLRSFTKNKYADYSDPFAHSFKKYSINSRIGSVILYNDRTKKIVASETKFNALFPLTNIINNASIKEAIYIVKGTLVGKNGAQSTGTFWEGDTGGRYNSWICGSVHFSKSEIKDDGYTKEDGIQEGTMKIKTRETIRYMNDDGKKTIDGAQMFKKQYGGYRKRCMQNLFINDVFIIKEGGLRSTVWFVGHY